jgi:hypothetical protein
LQLIFVEFTFHNLIPFPLPLHVVVFIVVVTLVIDCWLAFAYFLGFLGMFFITDGIYQSIINQHI